MSTESAGPHADPLMFPLDDVSPLPSGLCAAHFDIPARLRRYATVRLWCAVHPPPRWPWPRQGIPICAFRCAPAGRSSRSALLLGLQRRRVERREDVRSLQAARHGEGRAGSVVSPIGARACQLRNGGREYSRNAPSLSPLWSPATLLPSLQIALPFCVESQLAAIRNGA